MNTIPCPELCPDCPLKKLIPRRPRRLQQSDKFISPDALNSKDDSVAFNFADGMPVGRHFIEVGLVAEVNGNGIGFWVDSSIGLTGVAKAIENCKGTTPHRYGLFRLRKEDECGALFEAAEKT